MSKKNSSDTANSVWTLIEPIAFKLGLQIWDIKFLKEGSNWYLRVFIDKDEGVTIDDCENLSRAIDGPLDELDPISVSYFLEVSSPGVERELVRKEHFKKYLNEKVIVRFIRPIDGNRREIIAILRSFDDGKLTLSVDDEVISVSKKDLAFVKLYNSNI